MTTTTTRHDRWMAAHEGHELASDVVDGHHLTLCRTCNELNCRDCCPESNGEATP
ncbi:hypothetical protein [Nonomuraea wenchangensis]|uniref:Uncharacterized protein n=1 Tax=Nonomuraea wenchangensis TaxID=568860 RepID=A0A1I0EYK7_9ACTN|nr:hypothetical protein [Nonomuraea wenchangensis]SET50036.1 hypothetical protein SAMN05421811_103238 [Nonomuraea wenchangensis]